MHIYLPPSPFLPALPPPLTRKPSWSAEPLPPIPAPRYGRRPPRAADRARRSDFLPERRGPVLAFDIMATVAATALIVVAAAALAFAAWRGWL